MVIGGSLGAGFRLLMGRASRVSGRKAPFSSTTIVFPAPIPRRSQHMTHSLEYDAIHKRSIIRALTVPFPATLPAVEAKGHVSGRAFITIVARAVDLIRRVGLAA